MDRVIGIDVSKDRSDVFCLAGGRLTVGNGAAGVGELAGWGGEALFVMEASGGYERLAHRLLTARGPPVAIVNAGVPMRPAAWGGAKRVRDFARPAACWPRPTRSMRP